MKKTLLTISIFVLIFTVFVGCTSTPKLNDDQQKMLNMVMGNLDEWETNEGKYAVDVQLQRIDGEYRLCVGYSNEILQPSNKAVSTYTTTGPNKLFRIETEKFTYIGDNGSMILPADLVMGLAGEGTGRELIGNIAWYYSISYDEKYENIENMFLNLLEE